MRSRSLADWMEFRWAQRNANACYCAARVRVSQRCRDKLQSDSSVHTWWVTLKESIFGVDSSILPLRGVGGALVPDPALKAELLSEHYDSKHSFDSAALPLSCHPEPIFCMFALRCRKVERILLDLDVHGGVDPFFYLFFVELAEVLAPKLRRVFRKLLQECLFPSNWCCAPIQGFRVSGPSP